VTLLSVRGLTKAFGGNTVVSNVCFDVAAGERVALIGSNGAGKSTCFNMLNGQVLPDKGTIELDGTNIVSWSPDRICRAGIGRSFQIAATFGSLTVRDNVRTALIARHTAIWRFIRPASGLFVEDTAALLDRVGLSNVAGQTSSTLAYGNLKRLELALAIANRPRLLLMDEPTAGMTPADRRDVMDLIVTLAGESGCAVLFTEHDTDAVFRIANRVLVLDRGVLIAEGEPASVRSDPLVRAAYLGC
jgi:branched-chain amino acid transport system ATP-binding protein